MRIRFCTGCVEHVYNVKRNGVDMSVTCHNIYCSTFNPGGRCRCSCGSLDAVQAGLRKEDRLNVPKFQPNGNNYRKWAASFERVAKALRQHAKKLPKEWKV